MACLERLRAFANGTAGARVKRVEGQRLSATTIGQWRQLRGSAASMSIQELWGLARWVTLWDVRRWLKVKHEDGMNRLLAKCGIESKVVPWRGGQLCITFDDALVLAKFRKVELLARDIGMRDEVDALWLLLRNEGPQTMVVLAANLWRLTVQARIDNYRQGDGLTPRHPNGQAKWVPNPMGYPLRRMGQNRHALRRRNEDLPEDERLTDEEIEIEVQRREGAHQLEQLRQMLPSADYEALLAKVDGDGEDGDEDCE